MEKKVEIISLIFKVSLVAVVVFLVIKFMLKNKFIAQKNKKSKKVNFVKLLNEIDSKDLTTNFGMLERVSIIDLHDFEDELVKFYVKKFYSNSTSIKKLGEYLSFVDKITNLETKKIIIKTLKDATLQVGPETLAAIIASAIEVRVGDTANVLCFRKIAKEFILETIESNTKNISIFLAALKKIVYDLLSQRTLGHKGRALVAINYFTLVDRYK